MTRTDPSPPLLDQAALGAYLRDRLGPGDTAVQRHRAGHSNETFFVTHGDDELVLRRPPRGVFLPTAHDVTREYKVLSALNDSPVRSPRALFLCTDESVIGAPFYLMERIAGVVIRTELPAPFGRDDRAAIGEQLVDSLVELHEIDYEECGLGGLGKPSGYLDRQLRRWGGQLELTLPHTRPLPDLERVGEWLDRNRPASPATTLVHGDYKLDNVVFRPSPPARLVAILDWEMSTLGDPLADLGWMLSFWVEAGDAEDSSDMHRVTALEGFMTRADLARRYESATGRDVSALEWYRVLAVWKLAILLEGSYARHLQGMTDDPFFGELKTRVPRLARRAREIASA